ERNTELRASNRQVIEALEQQTATSEILRVISHSPTDLSKVLNTVAESAARLCGARDAMIFRLDGGVLRPVANFGSNPAFRIGSDAVVTLTRGSVSGRAVIDRQTIHVHDMAAESDAEFPDSKSRQRHSGNRTTLA